MRTDENQFVCHTFLYRNETGDNPGMINKVPAYKRRHTALIIRIFKRGIVQVSWLYTT
jgi:hypothetical protein